MAQALNKLTTRKVQSITEPGRHADGGGLYLVVGKDGAKRWVMLYRLPGRRREMGLGALISVPLARARELAAEARAKIASGIDPLEEKHAAARFVVPVAPVTFSDIAVSFMDDRERTWSNAKHRAQWRQTLEVQAAALWSMPVADIDTEHVLGVLRPIWQTKPETAQRIRGRVEAILDAAAAARKRGPDNAARWRGHLDKLLPRARKLTRGHHAAMPYGEVPAFYRSLAERVSHGGSSGPGMRLLILTAARSGEVRGMTWGEVDMASAVWVIPAERMKAGREHRVPLSAAAVRILAAMRKPGAKPAALVFPSSKGTSMSDMAFGMLLRKMSQPDVTTHGFRSSFRDWVGEETEFAGELAEAALAHLVGDAVERAYRRGDALEKRRHLMDAWAAFVAGESAAPSNTRNSSS